MDWDRKKYKHDRIINYLLFYFKFYSDFSHFQKITTTNKN